MRSGITVQEVIEGLPTRNGSFSGGTVLLCKTFQFYFLVHIPIDSLYSSASYYNHVPLSGVTVVHGGVLPNIPSCIVAQENCWRRGINVLHSAS
uniref:Histone_H2A_C domain-containing protein n=1 Tax=Heterorhabditis bacteriophora TaxID=37862 RepID=A0A1I7XS19_HETBA